MWWWLRAEGSGGTVQLFLTSSSKYQELISSWKQGAWEVSLIGFLIPPATGCPCGWESLVCLGSGWQSEVNSTLLGISFYFLWWFLMSLFYCPEHFPLLPSQPGESKSVLRLQPCWALFENEVIFSPSLVLLKIYKSNEWFQQKCGIADDGITSPDQRNHIKY